MMPERACLHPATAIQCGEFFSLFPRNLQEEFFLSSRFLQNSRLMERSLIRHNQYLMALYMSFLMIMRTYKPDHLARMQNGDFIKYIDFMPRSEGNFEQLALHLSGWLDTPEVCRVGQDAVAKYFNVTQAEVRPVILFALCMIFSRMVPVDHRQLLSFAFCETPLAGALDTLDDAAPSVAPQAGAVVQPPPPASRSRLVREPIAFLCPLIDLCNHSDSENVAVMVPDASSTYQPSAQHGPVICLRSLRDIAKGEELTMNYGAAPRELHMIWGMQNILQ
ncbi:hypothetical protein STCU_02081 [Strigomonas culicis]|nr:hypothetical protein STCU_02648 [Strigomonas culicis]EPY33685.1 hypothetical protein STCU_02081 [Strigomonas culicis]|eukprot:EPY32789.1 hypothetical protein STCU_02648 [Strigomonas culicis]